MAPAAASAKGEAAVIDSDLLAWSTKRDVRLTDVTVGH
jgi:hypothetical protein